MLRRFSVFSLALLLCLSLFPARAFAWDVIPKGVLYQGDVGESNYGAVVSAYNQFDAACYVLGKDPNTISASIREKLSDPNYGGKFYEYSQYFFTQSGTLEDVPGWVPAYIVMIGELGDLVLSDYQSVWYSSTTKALHDAALVDFKRVLYGEDLSGGGGSGGTSIIVGDYFQVGLYSWANANSAAPYQITATNATIDSDGVLTVGTGTRTVSSYPSSPNYVANARAFLSHSVVEVANGLISQGYKVGFSHSGAIVYAPDLVVSYGRNSSTGYQSCYYYYSPSGSIYYYSTVHSSFYYDGTLFCFVNDITGNPVNNGSYFVSQYLCDPISTPFFVPPSGVWPDSPEPASPTAPELPEPAEPVVQTPVTPTVPTPVWPDITINIDNDPTPGTTPSGLDYTELLTRMNDNLISIDSFARAINSNLNSLRSDLLAEFNGVIDSLRNVYNYLLTIDSVLETHCTHLRNKIEESAVFIANYMRTLIKWFADQLDYDDMTNVEAPDNSLLTTINEKLGGGTYEPNPIKDEQGYYEWLDDLWDRFLLGDNWQSSMGSISGSFSELKTRFPFSVPWDIVALFRLFVHDPVTPVFDLPLYFSADGSTPIHVDLSPWDSVASLVRPMIFVIFALKLALLSRDLLGGLGADKGGL